MHSRDIQSLSNSMRAQGVLIPIKGNSGGTDGLAALPFGSVHHNRTLVRFSPGRFA